MIDGCITQYNIVLASDFGFSESLYYDCLQAVATKEADRQFLHQYGSTKKHYAASAFLPKTFQIYFHGFRNSKIATEMPVRKDHVH